MYHIAIVDDNDSWCFVVAHLLQQHGYRVATFTEPQAFLGEAHRFDLALIDFSMPPRRYQMEMDGPDVISKVRQQSSQAPLLVLISSYFTEDCLSEASKICNQADACWSKQMEARELLQGIQQLLEERTSKKRSRRTDKKQQLQSSNQSY